MATVKTINTDTLCTWLAAGKPVSILDIRTASERAEWQIPGSIHVNAYDKLKQNDTSVFDQLHLDKNIPVIAYCVGGKLSLTAAELLADAGYDAWSLEGGMKRWSLAWNTASIQFPDFKVIQFRRTGKGCLSYMILSDGKAMVVDPSLDLSVYEEFLLHYKAELLFVAETHIHADHISRAKQLAEKQHAQLFLPSPNKVNFSFEPITEKTSFELGAINITVIQTPGHTNESISFLVDDKLVLTGDTLFTNGIGRPDLKSSEAETLQKAKSLYHSLQKLLTLDDSIIVFPSHTNKPVDFDGKPIQSTIGTTKSNLPILNLPEDDFTKNILEKIPATPANYLAISELNITGNLADINPVDLEAGPNRCAIS